MVVGAVKVLAIQPIELSFEQLNIKQQMCASSLLIMWALVGVHHPQQHLFVLGIASVHR